MEFAASAEDVRWAASSATMVAMVYERARKDCDEEHGILRRAEKRFGKSKSNDEPLEKNAATSSSSVRASREQLDEQGGTSDERRAGDGRIDSHSHEIGPSCNIDTFEGISEPSDESDQEFLASPSSYAEKVAETSQRVDGVGAKDA